MRTLFVSLGAQSTVEVEDGYYGEDGQCRAASGLRKLRHGLVEPVLNRRRHSDVSFFPTSISLVTSR